MKITEIEIKNIRSIEDIKIELDNYNLLIGENNSGKSNVIHAIRLFYQLDKLKWTQSDESKFQSQDPDTSDAWIELTFTLNEPEWDSLSDEYKSDEQNKKIKVRRIFKSSEKTRNGKLYGYKEGELSTEQFYGADAVGTGKLGNIIYIPALTTIDEQTKQTGPSPFREILNLIVSKMTKESKEFPKVTEAFEDLNKELNKEEGIIQSFSSSINENIKSWDIEMEISISSPKPADITKTLFSQHFTDPSQGDNKLKPSQFGHGFQRILIYELIKYSAKETFSESQPPNSEKKRSKEFSPDLNLLLFEEPESFLHHTQQQILAKSIREMSSKDGFQTILTTHSNNFVTTGINQINQIIRMFRKEGKSQASQIRKAKVSCFLNEGQKLLAVLKDLSQDCNAEKSAKNKAQQIINNTSCFDRLQIEEQFRYSFYLDSERSALFFAKKVLLVEGMTERAFFTHLIDNDEDWRLFLDEQIYICNVLGKYNFHRYISLLNEFKIPFGILLDKDEGDFHKALNDMIKKECKQNEIYFFEPDFESYFGIEKSNRADKKFLVMLSELSDNKLEKEKLSELKKEVKKVLNLE